MDWRHVAELLAAAHGVYGEVKNLCVWVKDNAGMGSLYRSQHELVFVFKHGCREHRNNVQLGRFGRNRSNVWRYPGGNSFGRCTEEGNLSALHPTVKPVAMIADAILDCSIRADIVLDGFLGSGTTLIAAERTGRRCYGLELDLLYVDTIVRRWQKLTGGSARHAASDRSFDDLRALLSDKLNEPVTVAENGRRRKISKREAIVTQLVNRSAAADFRAIKILLDIVRDIERQTEPVSPETAEFSESDEKVIEQLKARFAKREM